MVNTKNINIEDLYRYKYRPLFLYALQGIGLK